MNNTIKQISLMVFGGAAWMVCAVALPMHQAVETDGLMAKVSNLVITQAYAEDDKSKSDDEGKSDDDDKSKDKSSSSSSSSYDFSSDTLICVSRTSVETTLNISSESSDDSKSSDDKSKSDDEGKSDDKSSDKNDGKSAANESDSLMAKVLSLVISPAYANDDESKSDDKSKSDDDDKSKDKGDSESSDSSSSTVTSSDIDTLATCTALGQDGTEPGVWVPSTAVGDSAALTAYVQEVLVGGSTPSTPDSSMESYREIRGE